MIHNLPHCLDVHIYLFIYFIPLSNFQCTLIQFPDRPPFYEQQIRENVPGPQMSKLGDASPSQQARPSTFIILSFSPRLVPIVRLLPRLYLRNNTALYILHYFLSWILFVRFSSLEETLRNEQTWNIKRKFTMIGEHDEIAKRSKMLMRPCHC